MKNVLQVRGLTKAFAGRKVLENVSFELQRNSVSVLLGSNGTGKSTLLRCLVGLLKPDAGDVRILRRDPLRHSRTVHELVGYVPDEADACPWMTAPELFEFLRVQYRRWSVKKVRDLSERLSLPATARIGSMSRGEAAKTMLVAALAAQPRLLLLDEPFARLAPPVREEVLGVFLEEAPLTGGAVLLATHDLEVAGRAADRVLLLDGGRIAQDVEVEALLARRSEEPRLTAQLRELYPQVEAERVA
jgi:ABC-2 type transport system ATP-binding protein